MQGKAYWINPMGKILELPVTKHINQVTENPEKFGLTKDYIESTYEKYGEKINQEAKARDEIFLQLFKKGFIRIRLYINKYWSVSLNDFNSRSKKILQKWATVAKKERGAGPFMPVKIGAFKNNKTYSDWTVQDLAQSKHLYEGETSKISPEFVDELPVWKNTLMRTLL